MTVSTSASQGSEVVAVLGADGAVVGQAPSLTVEQVLDLYRSMLRVRAVDAKAAELVAAGRIHAHADSRAVEAAVVGSAFAARQRDWLFPARRELGALLLRGCPLSAYFGHLLGNAADPGKGRQLPEGWSYRDGNIACVGALPGAHLGHAAGFAWAAKINREAIAVLAYLSQDEADSADFHNSLNFAGVFNLPVVWLCRATGPSAAGEHVAGKGIAYGVASLRCDGNDVFAVIEATKAAVERAARGKGPTLIEAVVDEAEAADPCARLERYLAQRVGWDEGRQRALEAEISQEVDEALASAERAGPVGWETLFDDVVAELPWHLREQREELRRQRR